MNTFRVIFIYAGGKTRAIVVEEKELGGKLDKIIGEFAFSGFFIHGRRFASKSIAYLWLNGEGFLQEKINPNVFKAPKKAKLKLIA